MSESASESPKSSDLQELFELLSRQLDEDLGGEDSQRLAILQAVHANAATEFRRQIGELSGRLKQVPVCSVGRLLFETPPLTRPQAIVVPEASDGPRRSGSQRLVVGAVTSLLCAGLLFALIRRVEKTDTALLAQSEVLHGTIAARSGIGGAGGVSPMAADFPPVAEAIQMKTATDLSPNILMGAAAPAAPADSKVSVEAIPESGSEPDVQPLIQSDDWNVVVVRIDAKDRDHAMDQIQSIAKKAGLQLKGAAGPDESRWMGVVLSSNVAGREEVVNAMEGVGASNGYATETPPVDSEGAMFIAAARESLKHPTRSELHYGKVFVALPSPSAVDNEKRVVVAASEKPDSGSSETTTTEQSSLPSVATEDPASRSAKVSAKAVPDVTLVVFEFSDGEKSGPNSSGQQI